MSILEWPAELPRPERDTWSNQRQDARLKRQSDTGPQSYRRRFSNPGKQVALSLLVNRNGKAIFDNFFEYDTKMGSLLFWMPDPTTEGWAMQMSDGSPMLISGGPDDGKPILLSAMWLCTFGDQIPTETVIGTEFRMSFNVTVIP